MISRLVPTILNFTGNDITAAPPRTEPCICPQNPSSSSLSTHSSIVPGTQSAAVGLGEQSRQRAPLTEELDEHELRLPKMGSLAIMMCANMLLQVRTHRLR